LETQIKILKKVKTKNAILVEGLPGIGNVGRVAAGYLVSELKTKKIAELHSPHFLPLVILHENAVADLLKCEFFYYKGKRDIIFLTGDSQSISPEGHYEVSEKILEFAKSQNVKEVITLGGFAEGRLVEEPRVVGAVNKKELIKKYSRFGIDFTQTHPVGTIIGASGLLIGLARLKNMDGLCLMGETPGFPLITDPKAADKVLQVLIKILNIKVDLTKLENAVKDMEEKIKKTEEIYRKMMKQVERKDREQVQYIG